MPSKPPIAAADGRAHLPSLENLVRRFYGGLGEIGVIDPVDAVDLPGEYRTLLDHHSHMTVTLEAYHNSPLDVQVLAEAPSVNEYARNSLLTRQRDGAVVQFGIMRIELSGLPPAARNQIESHAAPLGRILISNGVLREVELIALWRIAAGPALTEHLGQQAGSVVYGRSARILVDGQPAVEVLEIVRP